MLHMHRRTGNDPEWIKLQKEKTFYQKYGLWITLKDLFWKLDVVGVLLLTLCLGCILVPLILAGGFCPFVLGWVLIPILTYWEWKYSRFPLLPYKLVKYRGVWYAMAVSFLITFIIWLLIICTLF